MAVVPNYGPDAAVNGAWSAPQRWPLIAIHAALMPDGRVATYGTHANGDGGRPAHGVFGRSGDVVDAFGLTCRGD